jgi:MFS transporter, DHA3 family, macrolide efflux protein
MQGEGLVLAKTQSSTGEERVHLFRQRGFLLMWVGKGLTGLALFSFMTAQSWYVVRELQRDDWMGWVLMVMTIPRLLLFPWGGVLADRFPRASMMSLSLFLRAFWIGAMLVTYGMGELHIAAVMIFSFGYGMLDAMFWPASDSILPELVEKEQLTRANSLIFTTFQLTMVTGPFITGAILTHGSYVGVFSFVTFFLLASGVVIRLLPKKETEKAEATHSPLQDLREGVQYVRHTSYLLAFLWVTLVVNFFFAGPVNAGLPVWVDQVLKGNALDLSYMEGSLGIGMVTGGLLVGWLNIRKKRAILLLGTVALIGLSMAAWSQATVLWQGMVALCLIGFWLSVGNVTGASLAQELIPKGKMGRVFSLNSTASYGLIPISHGLVSTLLSLGVSLDGMLWYSGWLLTLYVAGMLWKVKVLRTLD